MTEVVANEEEEVTAFGYAKGRIASGCGGSQVVGTNGSVFATEMTELATGAKDSAEIATLTFSEERECRNDVQKGSDTEHGTQFIVGQVLVEHQEVVAEIEERLAGRTGSQ